MDAIIPKIGVIAWEHNPKAFAGLGVGFDPGTAVVP